MTSRDTHLGFDISTPRPWFFELDENDREIASAAEAARLTKDAQPAERGKLSICYDDGPRPWWHRLFGPKRYVTGVAILEWADGYASLSFLDDNWSEHNVLDTTHPVDPPEAVRTLIAHGELQPIAADRCMEKERAFQAVLEALQSGRLPAWLSYEYVE